MGLKQIGGEIRAQPLNENFQYLDGKLLFGPESNRPNPGVPGRLYVTTDKRIIYEDTGTAWQKVGVVNWADIDGKPTSFTPSAHASTHAAGGSDPITPASIGAETPAGAQAKVDQHVAAADPHTQYLKKTGGTMTGTLKLNAEFPLEFIGGAADTPNQRNFRWDIYQNELRLQAIDDAGVWVGPIFDISHDRSKFWFNGFPVWHYGNSGPFYKGAGSPEGVVTAPPGSIYQNTNGGQGTTVYYKASGTGNTGWRAIA